MYVNRYVAAGFISRWMLFEGTWQRYNENNDELARKYLQLAVEAGDLVIKSGKYSIATPMSISESTMGAVFLSPFSCATASRGRARSWLMDLSMSA